LKKEKKKVAGKIYYIQTIIKTNSQGQKVKGGRKRLPLLLFFSPYRQALLLFIYLFFIATDRHRQTQKREICVLL
jgi:hypothetical protein